MPRYHATPNGLVQFTAEEEIKKDNELALANSSDEKLKQIKNIRLEKLIETDWYSNSDVTMPDNIKTWRQSLRDIPQDYTTESQYDLLLAKDSDGKLTHSIWSKP